MSRRVTIDRQYFLDRSEVQSNGCWLWKRYTDRLGYPRMRVGDTPSTVAHRVAYETLVGPVPDGHEMDHLCRNRSCVNPEHLEPVTHHENIHRGDTVAAFRAETTHCPYGHPYEGENLVIDSAGSRRCRICKSYANHILYLKHISADPPPKTRNLMVWGKREFGAIAEAKEKGLPDSVIERPGYRPPAPSGEDEVSDLDLLNRYNSSKGPYW